MPIHIRTYIRRNSRTHWAVAAYILCAKEKVARVRDFKWKAHNSKEDDKEKIVNRLLPGPPTNNVPERRI